MILRKWCLFSLELSKLKNYKMMNEKIEYENESKQ